MSEIDPVMDVVLSLPLSLPLSGYFFSLGELPGKKSKTENGEIARERMRIGNCTDYNETDCGTLSHSLALSLSVFSLSEIR